jgi:predicted N-acetyltransferase YhbS
MTITMRKAEPADLDTVTKLHQDARSWLSSRGLDQWQPMQTGRLSIDRVRSGFARSIAKGACFIAMDGFDPVGTITVDSFADPDFWTDQDDPTNALYIHRMIVPRSHAGRGIGEQLIDWAAERAAATGHQWLRLDAWRTNERLHDYYRSLGFQHVRTVNLPHRGSGALFQRRVATN